MLRVALTACLLAFAIGAFPRSDEPQEIIYYGATEDDDVRNAYFIELLRMVMQKTEDRFGPYKLRHSTLNMPQSRALLLLAQNGPLHVMWSMTSQKREEMLLPIRIPLLKGLLGWRVSLVLAEDRDLLAGIQNLDQLRAFTFGQGHDWPDTKILEANGFSVEKGNRYRSLFTMLERGRFRVFPRGVTEIWQELQLKGPQTFAIDPYLMLKYPAPCYFFVSKDQKALAERIWAGLQAAIADGTFDKLFYGYPPHQAAFEKLDLKQRKVIELNNPLLSPETPLADEHLWLNLADIPDFHRKED